MEHQSGRIVDGTSIDIDFQTAFDKISHKCLMTKLKAYEIQGDVLM